MKTISVDICSVSDNLLCYITNQMAIPDLELDNGNEIDPLIEQETTWTRMDKLLLVFASVVNLGDGIEIYLPGSFD